jgi:hypothetical protein
VVVEKKKAGVSPSALIACVPMRLDEEALTEAAARAIDLFPPNAPMHETDPRRIGVLAGKFWGKRAGALGVAFMERPSQAMIDKVLLFANSWGEFSAAKFHYELNLANAEIRISLGGGGYYSYLGTDCLQIPRNRNTMNLEGFSVNTRLSEWNRVVKHEFGHALGCPHEHQRADIIALLDARKVIDEFRRTQGWSEAEVRQQVLTPLEERSLMGASPADVTSIMSYQFSGIVTKNGQPIPGGLDFSPIDRQFFAKTYPKDDQPPPPPPEGRTYRRSDGADGSVTFSPT